MTIIAFGKLTRSGSLITENSSVKIARQFHMTVYCLVSTSKGTRGERLHVLIYIKPYHLTKSGRKCRQRYMLCHIDESSEITKAYQRHKVTSQQYNLYSFHVGTWNTTKKLQCYKNKPRLKMAAHGKAVSASVLCCLYNQNKK